MTHTTLLTAVLSNDVEAVKRLLDPNKDHALELVHAVLNQDNPNRYEIVKLLIPVSNVFDSHSAALRFAAHYNDTAMMDLLYDMSDPYAALAYLKNNTDEPRWRHLSDYIQMREAQQEKEILQHVVGGRPSEVREVRKM